MDRELLVALKDHQIVSVTLVVAEKQILAMGRVNLFPVLQSQFDSWERWMVMCLEGYTVIFKEFLYFFCLLAIHVYLFEPNTKIQNFLIIFVELLINMMSDMAEKTSIWDPLRKKEVALTPEERVRQWFIGILSAEMSVPMHMMMSETGFKLGDKQFRADILVYDRSARPLMVIECKRPEVELTEEVLDQAVRYNMALNVKYITITNGRSTFICRKSDSGYVFLNHVPKYEEMICQQ